MRTRPIRKGHRSALRIGRHSQPNTAYFLTKCVLERKRAPLARPDCAEVLIQSFRWARDRQWFRILGFVIMPDHYHLIIALGEVVPLERVMMSINRFTASQINKILRRTGTFWEEGYYDHAIRDRKDFDVILEYVHQNPVKAGLVQDPEEWLFSTAHPRFADLIDWDWLGPSLPDFVPTKHRFESDKIPLFYR